MDIYQEIWDADMRGNGLKAVIKKEDGNKSEGYIVVRETLESDSEHKIIEKVVIPKRKRKSYELAESLFDNYTLNQREEELNILDESKEIENLLNFVIESEPMKIARKYIEMRANNKYSDIQWYIYLHKIWFEQFDMGMNKDLSGFEHVFVGEQKKMKVKGYHFWFKYYLDDNIGYLGQDDIAFLGLKYDESNKHEGTEVPEVVTLKYKWHAYNYVTNERVTLTKSIGGFWVGPSVEGIMALGTIRFTPQAFTSKEAIINNVKYKLELHRSLDNKHLRTFFPKFIDLLD